MTFDLNTLKLNLGCILIPCTFIPNFIKIHQTLLKLSNRNNIFTYLMSYDVWPRWVIVLVAKRELAWNWSNTKSYIFRVHNISRIGHSGQFRELLNSRSGNCDKERTEINLPNTKVFILISFVIYYNSFKTSSDKDYIPEGWSNTSFQQDPEHMSLVPKY